MSEKFWDKIAKRYSKQPVADEDAYKEKIRITREYFNPDMEVLELGCGTGSTAIAHAPFVKTIYAIDISSKMIEIAQEKANSNNLENVQFKKSSIDELDVADQTFDVVMGHSILHLVENKDEVIAKVHKMLNKRGVFITSTACLGESFLLKLTQLCVSVGAYFGLLPILKAFTAKELLVSLKNAGFEIDYQWQPKKNSAVFIVAKKI